MVREFSVSQKVAADQSFLDYNVSLHGLCTNPQRNQNVSDGKHTAMSITTSANLYLALVNESVVVPLSQRGPTNHHNQDQMVVHPDNVED